MDFELFLFPYRAKFYGIFSILASLVFAYLYFWGGRPEFFNIKVFAVASVYLETRYFVIAQTNILDELAAVFLIIGITVFSFSKEKNENSLLNVFRAKALFYSLFLTVILWILIFLLIYGMAIFLVCSSVFLLYMMNYNLLFWYFLRKNKLFIKEGMDSKDKNFGYSGQK